MIADAAARAHRLLGEEVLFLTGTDEHGQKVERAAAKAGLPAAVFADQGYFFKLSAFQQPLRPYYPEHPYFIMPRRRWNEVVAFVEAGLQHFSIIRTSFRWGVPVPDDPAHVMYVWFDALTNYMTAVG